MAGTQTPVTGTNYTQAIIYLLSGTADPTTRNLTAPKGMIYIQVGDTGGKLWQKQDEGTSNTWTQFETGAGTGANIHLSNLAATAVNADILPAITATINLGTPALAYNQVATGIIFGPGSFSSNQIIFGSPMAIYALAAGNDLTVQAANSIIVQTGPNVSNNTVLRLSCGTAGAGIGPLILDGNITYQRCVIGTKILITGGTVPTQERSYIPVTSAADVTGIILAPASVSASSDGEIIKLLNIGAFNITIANSATVVNRGGSDYVLQPNSIVNYLWNSDLDAWVFDSATN